MAKKKQEVDVSILDARATLEKAVAFSILGRPIASIGSVLTGREKNYAGLVYHLLNAEKKFSDKWPVVAQLAKESKPKKTTPSDAIKWFAEKYPKEAEPLLAKLEEKKNKAEKYVLYGLREDMDLPDEFYVSILKDYLEIPMNEAKTLYHKILYPIYERAAEEEGLIRFAVK